MGKVHAFELLFFALIADDRAIKIGSLELKTA